MSIRNLHPDIPGIYFITFTCYNWIPLFNIASAWDLVYHQFDHLKSRGNHINGYVIMPNHLHALINFPLCVSNDHTQPVIPAGMINKAISQTKRFLAYSLVEALKVQGRDDILKVLHKGVNPTDRSRGKLHQVFQPSFDAKWCSSEQMIWEKLHYIHQNPCMGKWKLARNPVEYIHSSCSYYENGKQGVYEVMDYRDTVY